jgi:alkaline phosphatase D
MTAQMMPLGADEPKTVDLQVLTDDGYRTIASAEMVIPGWTATFRVEDWEADRDIPYRVVYANDTWSGTIRRDPVDQETIVVAGFTGNHNNRRGLEGERFDWKTGVWFPHDDLTRRVAKHEPDVLFFSGDQVYEGESPTRPDTANIQLDYLYKWYLWCWAFRDLTCDIPTVTIPDDHDVYQGNLWGCTRATCGEKAGAGRQKMTWAGTSTRPSL